MSTATYAGSLLCGCISRVGLLRSAHVCICARKQKRRAGPWHIYAVKRRRGGERERLKSRLMIRDDTRHSSLSDVRLDCRYCSSILYLCLLSLGVCEREQGEEAARIRRPLTHMRARVHSHASRSPPLASHCERWETMRRRGRRRRRRTSTSTRGEPLPQAPDLGLVVASLDRATSAPSVSRAEISVAHSRRCFLR